MGHIGGELIGQKCSCFVDQAAVYVPDLTKLGVFCTYVYCGVV